MTPRLKFLSFLLGLSLIYAVYDYIDRNSTDSKTERVDRRKNKRARTAGTTSNSAMMKKYLKRKEKREQENIQKKSVKHNDSQTNQFSKISEDFSNLDGWSRNPFIKFEEPKALVVNRKAKDIAPSQKFEEPTKQALELNALDRLNIETAVSMGDKAFVTINGKRYREGDLIDDALIEKIENEQVTFRVGTTTIIKNVGI